MKEKKKKTHSFAKRLTWRVVLALLITMSLASYFICRMSMTLIELESDILYHGLLNNTRESLQRVFSDVHVAAVNNAYEIEANLPHPDRMQAIMERMVSQNPYIRSCGISFVKGYYPQKGDGYQPYACRQDSGTVITRGNQGKQDYLNAEWFVEALKSKEGYWGKPFFAGGDSLQPVVPYIMPIRDRQGVVVAVMGADLSLTWLQDELERIQQRTFKNNIIEPDKNWDEDDKHGRDRNMHLFAFVTDRAGTYITFPDKSRILHDNIFNTAKELRDTTLRVLAQEMTAGKNSANNEFMVSEKVFSYKDRDYCLLYAPIDFTNWSIGMVIPSLAINMIGYALMVILIVLIVLALLVLFVVCRITIRRTAKPLTQLAESAHEVAKGHFDAPLPVIKHNDEISHLRDSFQQMQESLTLYVDELKLTTAAKVAIESELKIAHDIQMSMLPKTFPPYPERHDIDIFGMLTPAKGVGGDLFDFYIRDERLFFCIGDVSGKGVPASLVMAVTRALFRNVSNHEAQANIIMQELNTSLADNNDNNMFVTLFIGVLHLKTGLLEYCNAGHDAPLLLGRKVGWLPCDSNLPLGVESSWQFTLQKEAIDTETTIFLFTDGLNEAEDFNHAQFGEERVLKVAEAALSENSHQPQMLIKQMERAVHDFVGGAEQSDDLTMLAIQFFEE